MGDEDFVIESPRSKYVVHSSGVSEKVRVGSEYQADIPDCIRPRENGNKADVEVEALDLEQGLRLWTPVSKVPEAKIQEFLHLATSKHGYSLEQAHGLLFWHKCNIDEAMSDLTAYTPAPSQWNNEEREIFAQSVEHHKDKEDNSPSILEIHKDLPHKSSKSLVDYYYKFKGDNLRQQSLTKRCNLPDRGAFLENVPKRYRTDSPSTVRSALAGLAFYEGS